MAIEKMKLLSIVGKEANINDCIVKYIVESGIEPQNALKVFEKGWKLSYFEYDNSAKELLKNCEEVSKNLKIDNNDLKETNTLKHSLENIKTELQSLSDNVKQILDKIQKNVESKALKENQRDSLNHLINLDVDLQELYHLRYMRFRYGKISKENYEKIKLEIDDTDAILIDLEKTEDIYWIIYITTANFSDHVDSLFNIVKFERIWLPDEVYGKPIEYINDLNNQIKKVENDNRELEIQLADFKGKYNNYLKEINAELKLYIKINNAKKFMAHDNKGNFYVVGWIPSSRLNKIMSELSKENDMEYVIKAHDEVAGTPPTKLKNSKFIKPFEALVKMYGLPNYSELDPTFFIAITTFLMFGFMFGDVGQGAIIAIIGLALMMKRNKSGYIVTIGGISSIIFGFLYGSVFGKEGIIPSLLISPMRDIQKMLIIGIGTGVFLILTSMILNIINGIKNKDYSKILFDSNGIAGLLLYLSIIALVINMAANISVNIPITVLASIIITSLILIFIKEDIKKFFHKKHSEGSKTSFTEKIFEMLEMLLSIASNTISFIRLSAFAINHVRTLYGSLYIGKHGWRNWKYNSKCYWKYNHNRIRRANSWDTSFKTRIL
jgi:V/A-type H+-transporting ATPase subunit I